MPAPAKTASESAHLERFQPIPATLKPNAATEPVSPSCRRLTGVPECYAFDSYLRRYNKG